MGKKYIEDYNIWKDSVEKMTNKKISFCISTTNVDTNWLRNYRKKLKDDGGVVTIPEKDDL